MKGPLYRSKSYFSGKKIDKISPKKNIVPTRSGHFLFWGSFHNNGIKCALQDWAHFHTIVMLIYPKFDMQAILLLPLELL